MINVTNRFGNAPMLTGEELGKVYVYNCACLTIHTEVLGWCNANKYQVVLDPGEADTILILGCQVTDLSVLNDILTAERFREKYFAKVVIGGCLAQRFDIPLDFARVDLLESDYTHIADTSLVTWQKPFWERKENFLRSGSEAYIRVGKGCHGKCTYCTIRQTRKDFKMLSIPQLTEGIFKAVKLGKTVVPTCDTLKTCQIRELSYMVGKFFLRNIEPPTLLEASTYLDNMLKCGSIAGLHVPIQSLNSAVLKSMSRDPEAVYKVLTLLKDWKQKYGIQLATNIISHYPEQVHSTAVNGKLEEIFDHVAENPYWGGGWDRKDAWRRMIKYIPDYRVTTD